MSIYANRIRTKLAESLAPTRLAVEDDSNRHIGHAGAHPSGETHFNVTVESAAFAGKNRVARQRLVYGILADELRERVHALSLKLTAPGE
ncbi:MAG: BolA family transcriptional regulator [Rhodospirillaceae bacterium]|nr:BolA family transcriptional regulator [Rhodospirillaceae bacterium]